MPGSGLQKSIFEYSTKKILNISVKFGDLTELFNSVNSVK